jgi:hypothetical protein
MSTALSYLIKPTAKRFIAMTRMSPLQGSQVDIFLWLKVSTISVIESILDHRCSRPSTTMVRLSSVESVAFVDYLDSSINIALGEL